VERPDGQASLLVVVVGTEELHAEAGKLLFEGIARRGAQQEKAVHELPTLSAQSVGVGLQRGSSPDDGASTPDEKLSARPVSARCRHELD
jgi:hypothetical protein